MSQATSNQQPTHYIEQAHQSVAALAAAQQRSNRLTLAFGAISMLIVSGYFSFVYQRLAEHLEPEAVVDIAQSMLEERWPEAKESLESKIRTSAPDWAAQLSGQARSAMPQARTYLQDYALAQTDEVAVQAINLSEDQFREFLQQRRPLIQQAFQNLAKSPAEAESQLAELRKQFEEQLDSDFQAQMKQVLHTAQEMNDKLATLRSGQELTPEQQLERQVLMLTRRLQTEQLPVQPAEVATSGGQ